MKYPTSISFYISAIISHVNKLEDYEKSTTKEIIKLNECIDGINPDNLKRIISDLKHDMIIKDNIYQERIKALEERLQIVKDSNNQYRKDYLLLLDMVKEYDKEVSINFKPKRNGRQKVDNR